MRKQLNDIWLRSAALICYKCWGPSPFPPTSPPSPYNTFHWPNSGGLDPLIPVIDAYGYDSGHNLKWASFSRSSLFGKEAPSNNAIEQIFDHNLIALWPSVNVIILQLGEQ